MVTGDAGFHRDQALQVRNLSRLRLIQVPSVLVVANCTTG